MTVIVSLPSAYDADMLPPDLSVKSFAIDSPRPVDLLAVSTVKKRSNSFAVSTSERSDDVFENDAVPSAVNNTDRSPSLYFTALEIMFPKTRDTA